MWVFEGPSLVQVSETPLWNDGHVDGRRKSRCEWGKGLSWRWGRGAGWRGGGSVGKNILCRGNSVCRGPEAGVGRERKHRRLDWNTGRETVCESGGWSSRRVRSCRAL